MKSNNAQEIIFATPGRVATPGPTDDPLNRFVAAWCAPGKSTKTSKAGETSQAAATVREVVLFPSAMVIPA